MPKSKRAQVIHLTKVKGIGKPRKAGLIEEIQSAADEFKLLYVFKCHNMRANYLKEIRTEFRDSRFFLGKNSVMKIALGRNKEEAYRAGLDEVANAVEGGVGLLFTSRKSKAVEKFFKDYKEMDYARSGFIATNKEIITKGALLDSGNAQFPSSMFDQFRALHLPLTLRVGVLELDDDFTICNEGDTLTPEQAQLLRLFGRKQADFRVELIMRWREGEATWLVEKKTDDDEKME